MYLKHKSQTKLDSNMTSMMTTSRSTVLDLDCAVFYVPANTV